MMIGRISANKNQTWLGDKYILQLYVDGLRPSNFSARIRQLGCTKMEDAMTVALETCEAIETLRIEAQALVVQKPMMTPNFTGHREKNAVQAQDRQYELP